MEKKDFKKVKLLILDVDGILTDGNLFVSDDGLMFRRYNVLDGFGIRSAIDKGLKIVVISGGKTESIILRCEFLGIEDIYTGRVDKLNVYVDEIRPKYGYDDSEVAFMGDDVFDIPLLEAVGFPVTVPNAHQRVKNAAKYITGKNGGEGAVREVIDLIMGT